MDEPKWAYDTFLRHAAYGDLLHHNASVCTFVERKDSAEFEVLELGPGDSIFTAIIANRMGASKSYLVDVADAALSGYDDCRRMIRYLEDKGFCCDDLISLKDSKAIYDRIGLEYAIRGIESIKLMESNSIDFIVSNSVLEHLPKREFEGYMEELYRVLRPGGKVVHHIDLKDHLGGGLYNLRFSEQVWERPLFSQSGFYTNRIRCNALIELITAVGFHLEKVSEFTWSELPISRESLAAPFRYLSEEELKIRGVHIALTKNGEDCK
ncbi:class I SAM-dependent methyltransferase [Exilibacterium tricleocarpae]|nr:class I SAM-dependent methyltransferase [Exilibacterium tricleocarpae]